MTMVNSFPDKMNLSFSGCGFLCIYHAGVAAAIKEYAPQLTENKISGASAGAIVAAGLICGVCISQATSTILSVVTQARSRALGPVHPAFNLLAIVRTELHRTLPEDAYKRCTGRLQISLTRWSDSENVIVTDFDSNEELIDAIICSCFIPIYCGFYPPKYRGVSYIDGGFTDNQPDYDDHTVTVSPFSGESDICPPDWDSASFFGICFSKTSIRFTTRNLFRLTACLMPPSTEDCSKMCLQGFEDGLRFLTKNGMAPCIRCLTIQTNQVNQTTPGQVAIPVDDRRGMSPMTLRARKRNSTNRRGRLDSEGETCCDSEHKFPSSADTSIGPGLPNIMQKPFDDAMAAETSVFDFLMHFRLARYARVAGGFCKLPWDMFLIISKRILESLGTLSFPAWFIDKLNLFTEFVKAEIEHQTARYRMFSCQLALTELEQKKSHFVHVEQKELQIEMSEQAKKELETLMKRDKMRKKKGKPVVVPTPDLDWTGGNDFDSYEHAVEYAKNHDAMYAFHYLDDQNKVRSYEVFNMAEPAKRHMCHTHQSNQQELVNPRPVSMVLEEDECPPGGSHEEVDSGLSGLEQTPRTSSGKRDACCSPVRDFPPASPHHHSSSSRSVPSVVRKTPLRRHTTPASSPVTGRRSTLRDAVSSDSEVDVGERLFYPARHMRRPSTDYDGEPEPSDTDIGC